MVKKIVVTLRNFYDASFISEKIRVLHKAPTRVLLRDYRLLADLKMRRYGTYSRFRFYSCKVFIRRTICPNFYISSFDHMRFIGLQI